MPPRRKKKINNLCSLSYPCNLLIKHLRNTQRAMVCAVNTMNVNIISVPISNHAQTACPDDIGFPPADASHICAAVHSSVHKSKFFLRNACPAVPTTAAWGEAAFTINFGACISEAETFREFASRPPRLWLHLSDKAAESPCSTPLRPRGPEGPEAAHPPPHHSHTDLEAALLSEYRLRQLLLEAFVRTHQLRGKRREKHGQRSPGRRRPAGGNPAARSSPPAGGPAGTGTGGWGRRGGAGRGRHRWLHLHIAARGPIPAGG